MTATESTSRNSYLTPPCLVCGQPVPAGRSRTTCSDACRQAAWRRRHQPHAAPPDLPRAVPKKPSTVYECPECGGRLLGEQRCEPCGTFMMRIGRGGLSPCCDEPLTIDELLGTA
jgi:hypothetical protein